MNIPTQLPQVTLHDGQPVTTSLDVASHFGKRHAHVLVAIQNILESVPEAFSQPNFGLADYLDAQSKPRPMYHITRDGFALLAMGFTGPAAMAWKIAYITAFNHLEQELRYRELARLEKLDHRLRCIETALYHDHPAWPIIQAGKSAGMTHRELLRYTGHKSPDTIRRNLRRMARYGVDQLRQIQVAGNA